MTISLQRDTEGSDRPGGGDAAGPDLAGWSVGITAARRADELQAMLLLRGARVVHAPAVQILPLTHDAELRRTTEACIAAPIDIVVVITAIGFRGWLEAADGWGLGEDLRERLSAATVMVRGSKAAGAVRAAGLSRTEPATWDSTWELLAAIVGMELEGRRIVVQLYGEPVPDFITGLRIAGAEVFEVGVYQTVPPPDDSGLERLIDQVLTRQLHAITFTSAAAATNLFAVAARTGSMQGLVAALSRDVVAGCVGETTSWILERRGVPTVVPPRPRMGALVRVLTEALAERSIRLRVGARELEVRGWAALVDGDLRPLPPAPMAVLEALARRPGRVFSRAELLRLMPGPSDDAHTVEMAVTRLRSGLGDLRCIETVIKRGYRLAAEDVSTPGGVGLAE